MTRSVANFMVEALQLAGVKRVYGIVVDSLSRFTDSLRRTRTIDWVLVRHEEAAVFAAGAGTTPDDVGMTGLGWMSRWRAWHQPGRHPKRALRHRWDERYLLNLLALF